MVPFIKQKSCIVYQQKKKKVFFHVNQWVLESRHLLHITVLFAFGRAQRRLSEENSLCLSLRWTNIPE